MNCIEKFKEVQGADLEELDRLIEEQFSDSTEKHVPSVDPVTLRYDCFGNEPSFFANHHYSECCGSCKFGMKNCINAGYRLKSIESEHHKAAVIAFTNALFNPMDKSIKEMVASFLKGISQMIAQALILKAIKSGMSSMGVAFAKGGVFDGGGVQAFASGGVVTRPTPFKFASGGSFKNGLMGEAGPEAIMPLKRGSDGRLGVSMSGGGGAGDTVVNITVNQGSEEKSGSGANNSGKALADKLKSSVLEVIMNEKRPGGLLYR